MEELINELDIFVNEKAVLSAQIRDIESKRNELAKERNTKKAQNKINNDEDVWSEVNCLGKQISDLGNQSQWFQNQINSKLLRVREQAFIEIDNLIAESVRKSRIISEQIEENRDNLDPEEIYELTDNINEIGQSMARIMFAKRLIKHNQIVDVINLFSTTEIEESQEQSEQINEIIEKQEIENKFLATIACKAAVKANMDLVPQEVEYLIQNLLTLKNPYTCPHGRPTAIKMSKNDIEKKFQDDDTILMVGHGCSLYAFIKTLLKNQKLDFPQNASAIIVNKVNNEYQLETVLNPK